MYERARPGVGTYDDFQKIQANAEGADLALKTGYRDIQDFLCEIEEAVARLRSNPDFSN
jgi:hypothetical protein